MPCGIASTLCLLGHGFSTWHPGPVIQPPGSTRLWTHLHPTWGQEQDMSYFLGMIVTNDIFQLVGSPLPDWMPIAVAFREDLVTTPHLAQLCQNDVCNKGRYLLWCSGTSSHRQDSHLGPTSVHIFYCSSLKFIRQLSLFPSFVLALVLDMDKYGLNFCSPLHFFPLKETYQKALWCIYLDKDKNAHFPCYWEDKCIIHWHL